MSKGKAYRCKSRVASWGVRFEECPYHCRARAEFKPRACLHTPVWQEWEEEWEEVEEGEKQSSSNSEVIF